MAWIEPKTDWKSTDRFNFQDYNRIKGNLKWLHEKAVQLNRPFEIEDMGEDYMDYESYWSVEYFNAWEENLEIINKNIMIQDYGIKKTFYPNGIFIQWDELNRIEGATLSMKSILDRQAIGIRRIPYRLGNFKGMRV